jgi:hypothetical protein
VCNPVQQTPENTRIKEEIQKAVDAVSVPEEIQTSRARTWKILVHDSGIQRKMDVFEDATPSEKADENVLNSTENASGKKLDSSPLETLELDKSLEVAAQVIPEHVAPVLPANQIAPVQAEPQPALEPSADVVLPDPEAHVSSKNTKQVIRMKLPVTPKQIADEIGAKPFQVIAILMKLKVFTNLNTSLMDAELVKEVFQTFGVEFEPIKLPRINDAEQHAVKVITEMGTIDLPIESNVAQVTAKMQPAASERPIQEEKRTQDVDEFSEGQPDSDNFSAIKTPSSEKVAFKYSITIDGPESIREIAYKLGTPLKDVLEFAQQRGLQPYPSTVLDVRSIQVIAAKNGLGVKIARDIARL